MKNLKNDPSLAELPPPVTLTLEQLSRVATHTSEAIGGGGFYLNPYIIAGGIWAKLATPVAVPQVSAGQIAI